MTIPLFPLGLDAEDRALLEATAKAEKLTRSDVLRRALRDYAKRFEVMAPTKGAK